LLRGGLTRGQSQVALTITAERGPLAGPVRSAAVDPEPGEQVFFNGHPVWPLLDGRQGKGMQLVLVGDGRRSVASAATGAAASAAGPDQPGAEASTRAAPPAGGRSDYPMPSRM
jgi:hypothetical protein